jgi:hypothetical protein
MRTDDQTSGSGALQHERVLIGAARAQAAEARARLAAGGLPDGVGLLSPDALARLSGDSAPPPPHDCLPASITPRAWASHRDAAEHFFRGVPSETIDNCVPHVPAVNPKPLQKLAIQTRTPPGLSGGVSR